MAYEIQSHSTTENLHPAVDKNKFLLNFITMIFLKIPKDLKHSLVI